MDAKPEPGRSQPGVGVQFRGSERGRGGMSDHVGGGGAAVGGGGCPDRRAGVRQGSAGRVRATADGMRIGDGGCPRESGGLNGGGSSDKHGWDPVSRAKGRRCWWVTWGRDPGVRRSGTLVSAQRRSTYGCPGPGPTYRSPGPDRPSPEGRIGVAVGVQTERRPERVAGEARVGIGLERRWVSRVGSWWVSRTVAQNRRPGGVGVRSPSGAQSRRNAGAGSATVACGCHPRRSHRGCATFATCVRCCPLTLMNRSLSSRRSLVARPIMDLPSSNSLKLTTAPRAAGWRSN